MDVHLGKRRAGLAILLTLAVTLSAGTPARADLASADLAVTGLVGRAPAGLVGRAPAGAASAGAASIGAALGEPHPGAFTGYGFDACTAPPSASMRAWLASPYRAVGIYFGGSNRACLQPNLTAAWVSEQQAAGWHLMPIYLGLQASCTGSTKRDLIDNTQAAAQGRAQAEDAAAQASALSLARDSVLIFDMESYRTDDPACRAGVLEFLSAWTARLHDLSYLSGFYSSMTSGVADQVAAYPTVGYVHPDYLDFARWDLVATVADANLPATYWSPQRRMKQYRGGHQETWGGVTINIDNDYLDVAPLPPAGFGDFTGNGWSDLLIRATSNGTLASYSGNGTTLDLTAGRVLGTGWAAMDAIVRIGDLDQDGHEDVVARQTSTGQLWFYPGTGTGLAARKQIGTGWGALREITSIGDFNRDGYPDLLASQTSDKSLYLYPGQVGATLGPRVLVGSGGWDKMSELAGVGDLDHDGYADLVARLTSSGALYFYAGRPAGFAPRVQLGTGWGAMRDLVGVGDFDRDGNPDLAAVETANGTVYLYPGNGGVGFGARVSIGTGFGTRTPLL